MLISRATAAFGSSVLLSLVTIPAQGKPVTFTGTITPEARQTNHFTVTVQMEIGLGWHTYDDVGDGAEIPTTLELKLPEGAESASDWSRPAGIDGHTTQSTIYVGMVEFSKRVLVKPSAYGKTIEALVSYQACTDQYCNPPQDKIVSIEIPAGGSSARDLFDAPVRLKVKDAFLNVAAKKRFPSPAMIDVDDDGQAELVVGELMGSVGVYENQNTSGTGDPIWGPRTHLKTFDGKRIRTSNW